MKIRTNSYARLCIQKTFREAPGLIERVATLIPYSPAKMVHTRGNSIKHFQQFVDLWGEEGEVIVSRIDCQKERPD